MKQEVFSILNDIFSKISAAVAAALDDLLEICAANTSQIADFGLKAAGVILLFLFLRWIFLGIPKKIKSKNTKTETTYPELEKLKKTETKSELTGKGHFLLLLYWMVIIAIIAAFVLYILNGAS